MGKTVRRAYEFLLRPTARQVGRLAACLEDHRQLYNAALQERREAWRRAGVTGHDPLQLRHDAGAGHQRGPKTGLNRSILDAGWGVFLRVLADKAESAGRLVIAVNPANTSRTCPHCGHRAAQNRTTQTDFTCVRCGYTGHADVVGATNILRAGLALQTATAA